MRLGFTLPLPGVPLHAHGEWLRELEDLGYTDLWTQETGGYDAFTPLAVAAGMGSRLRLGTAIAQVPTRGPAVLAGEAAALAEAAPGRFVLGIGSSSPAIVEGWNDLPFAKPYSRVRDTLRFLRRALAGERIDESYETFAVRGFKLERAPEIPPPIFVAGLRERMLGLAGEESDGALLSLLTADDIRRVAPLVRAHDAKKEMVLRVPVCPIDDAPRARAIGRKMLGRYLNVPVYRRLQQWLGRADELEPVWACGRAGDWDGAARAVPEDLVDALFVHGPPERCREALAELVDAGLTTPIIGPYLPGLDLREALRALAPKGGRG
jgi:probable F420-dependent oxidoreductase